MISKVSLGKYNPLKNNPLSPKRRRPKTGLAPGSLIHTGKVYTDKVRISVIDYSGDRFDELEITDINALATYNHPDSVTWINVQGLHDVGIVGQIGAMLGLHSLTLEDILDTNQRPKVEEFDDHCYLTLKMINHVEGLNMVDIEQVSLVIHKHFVLCFQERPGDVFDSIRTRLKDKKGRARQRGSDYLGYMLLDIMIDFYYETLDEVWFKIEELEEIVVRKPERIELKNIQIIRRDLIQLRRYIYPVRDVVHNLTNRYADFFEESTLIYMRDSYDHVIQVVETLDTYREILTSIMDLYLSQLSMKMNEVMKVLTLIATIFIPLTFIAGVYGMNFEHMPELAWEISYPTGFYSIIAAVMLTMVIYMKRKKWF